MADSSGGKRRPRGAASVGNMGSALRYGYTALGNTVNLSSRLEGLNKDYGTHIIVNETTYAATREAKFVYRELDLIRVKGKTQPVMIYELIGRRRRKLIRKHRECAAATGSVRARKNPLSRAEVGRSAARVSNHDR
jgi:Adenylate and Guanylate cyclase catalytic domain